MTYQGAVYTLGTIKWVQVSDSREAKEREAVAMAIEALEKQIPKKLVEYNLCGVAPFMFGTGKCPSCDEGCNSDMRYCDKCGQKLRWFND